MRAVLAISACLCFCAPAWAESAQEVGQMRLYIQQLETQVRTLTGENERLTHELSVLRAQTGPQTDAQTGQGAPVAADDPIGQRAAEAGSGAGSSPADLGAPPRDLGATSISPDDPLIAPDGAADGSPVDLSALANGTAGPLPDDNAADAQPPGSEPASNGEAGAAGTATASLSGSSRDEYDLAYGYILTGDYRLAEQGFTAWLAHFPGDPQAADAQFWLGESRFQQRRFREAASTFLALYKATPQSSKAPDALLKLGMSLSALGEKNAACATLAEVGRKYAGKASATLLGRVHDEAGKAGCS